MNFKKGILLLGDIVVYYLALFLTLVIRYQEFPPSSERIHLHLIPFSIVLIIWLITFLVANLYSLSFSKRDLTFITSWIAASGVNVFLAFVFFYIVPTGIRPRANMFLLAALFFALQYLWRTIFQHSISNEYVLKPTVFIGSSPESLELARVITKKPGLGFRVAGFMRANSPIHEFPTFPTDQSLARILDQHSIKCIVLDEGLNDAQIIKDIFLALSKSAVVYNVADFMELITGKIPVSIIRETWFLQNIAKRDKKLYETIKRIMDVMLMVIAAIPSLLVIPIVAIIIKLTSPGPVFFKQIRVGRFGKPFHAIKFRSMVVDAERNGPQWATRNDPRITPFGRFMRATRLDEIPQLWNIAKGDLTFVGPRPERPEFVERLKISIPYYNERHLVKPGLTGWAQINFPYGASEADAFEKLQYELFYIKNRSIWLDVLIILKTIKTVLAGDGQ